MTSPGDSGCDDVDYAFARFCRDGDNASLEVVFRNLSPMLYRRACQLLRDRSKAMDLVQATFMAAIEGRSRFRVDGQVAPWLRGILEHKGRDTLRRARSVELIEEPTTSGTTSHTDAVAEAELAATARAGIERLEEPYRTVLRRALLNDQPAEVIARDLVRPAATVRSQLRRGLQRLKRSLPAVVGALLRAQAWRVAIVAGIVAVAAWVAWPTPQQAELAGRNAAATASAVPSAAAALEIEEVAGSVLPAREDLRSPAASATAPPPSIAPPSEVRVRLQGALDAAPIAGVEVIVQGPFDRSVRLLTSADGDVRHVAGWIPTEILVPFAGLQVKCDSRTPAPIEVTPGFAVVGRVIGMDGTAAPGARIFHVGSAGELLVATASDEGRFVVRDLQPGRAHVLQAEHRGRASDLVRASGSTGATLPIDFVLDQWSAQRSASASDATAAGGDGLEIECTCSDGRSLHGWLAVVLAVGGDDVVASGRIVGNTAWLPGAPAGSQRGAVLPPPAAGDAANLDPRILTRRHGTTPRPLVIAGTRARLVVPAATLPSAWLSVVDGEHTAAGRRVVILDELGLPNGIYEDAHAIGPIRPGTWFLASIHPGRAIHYQGPLRLEPDQRLLISEPGSATDAELRFRLHPPSQAAQLCALSLCRGDAILPLGPRPELAAPVVVVPGPYSVYYGYEGGACRRVDIDARPGANDLDLVSAPGFEQELVFDYGQVVVREPMTMLDLVVRDLNGRTTWRERVHAPIAGDGTTRIRRRFRDPNGVIQVFDRRGGAATVSLTPQPGPLRILLR